MKSAKRPAALIVNPSAGRSTSGARGTVIAELEKSFRLEVYMTERRDEATDLAARVADAGAALVIAYGGDGHVNEVVNGIAESACALGIIPGGTMNVFARALGIPLDPLAAAQRLAEACGRAPRSVTLGSVDGRMFTFSAGCGFDALAADLVERYVPAKRRVGQLFFYWSAFRVLAGSYRHRNPTMTLRGAFGERDVAMVVAANAGPYAYFLNRPVVLTPEVDLDRALDVFALRRMRIEALPLYAWGALVWQDMSRHPGAFTAHDVETFEVSSPEPFARHVDGEPIAASEGANFSVVRDALRVFA